MGIVFKQSFRNTLIIYSAFLIGGLNIIIFYPRILGAKFYGLVTILLSSSNIIMPLIAFGIQYVIIKYFSFYKTKKERDTFLSSVIFLPIFIALPIGFFWDYMHEWILQRVTEENRDIESYTFFIYIIAICCAYFELFYSWAKVQLNTVFGNILKELWNRVVQLILLLAVFFEYITPTQFIWCLTLAYILRSVIMMGYALYVYLPKFYFKLPRNSWELIKYALYMILAGSAGAILLDIDKIMIPGKETMAKAAYYTVAVFIGTFIEAPSRAMSQILQPLTSKSLNEANTKEVESLYKKSSINLLLIGGLFFLLINCSVKELFKIMPDSGYAGGELVVLMISFAKLYGMFLGNNRDIINNSKFYKVALPLSICMALSVYFLNTLFYYNLEFGTDGLALATLITLGLSNTFKIWFVKYKFSITPFTNTSIKLVLIIVILFCGFYFWDFSIPSIEVASFNISPLLNILFKCIILLVLYLFLVIRLSVSNEINSILKRFIKL